MKQIKTIFVYRMQTNIYRLPLSVNPALGLGWAGSKRIIWWFFCTWKKQSDLISFLFFVFLAKILHTSETSDSSYCALFTFLVSFKSYMFLYFLPIKVYKIMKNKTSLFCKTLYFLDNLIFLNLLVVNSSMKVGVGGITYI